MNVSCTSTPSTAAATQLEWPSPTRSDLVAAPADSLAPGVDLDAYVGDTVRGVRASQDLHRGSVAVLDGGDLPDAAYVSDSLVARPGRLTNPSAYVFLDVDGIINPYARKLPGLEGWETYVIDRYEVWYSDYLRNWLHNLIDNNVQIVWATTWVEHPANLFDLALLWELPTDLPCIDGLAWDDLAERRFDCGKRTGVDRWLTENNVDTTVTPVAWVDDMIGPGDLAFAQARGITPIVVERDRGLSEPLFTDAIEAVVLP